MSIVVDICTCLALLSAAGLCCVHVVATWREMRRKATAMATGATSGRAPFQSPSVNKRFAGAAKTMEARDAERRRIQRDAAWSDE